MLAGEVMFGTDSHTCNAGAFGQFASGIGNTDAGFILGTGKLLIKVPPSIRFVLDGEMPSYLLAKDIILQIIGEITVAGKYYPAWCQAVQTCSVPCLRPASAMLQSMPSLQGFKCDYLAWQPSLFHFDQSLGRVSGVTVLHGSPVDFSMIRACRMLARQM